MRMYYILYALLYLPSFGLIPCPSLTREIEIFFGAFALRTTSRLESNDLVLSGHGAL